MTIVVLRLRLWFRNVLRELKWGEKIKGKGEKKIVKFLWKSFRIEKVV